MAELKWWALSALWVALVIWMMMGAPHSPLSVFKEIISAS